MNRHLPHDEILTRFASRLACYYSCEGQTSTAPMASTLPHFLASNDVHADRFCTFPSLSIKTSRREKSLRSCLSARVRDDAAARELNRPTRVRQRSLALAPSIILRNILSSFGLMLEECLQDSVYSLVEECSESQLKSGQVPAALKELSYSARKNSPISPVEVTTDFISLAKGDFKSLDSSYDEIAIPLEFHASFKLTVLGKKEVTVRVVTPGSVSGIFKSNRAESIDVSLDTKILIKAMKKACKKIVKETMAIATSQNGTQNTTRETREHRQDDGDHVMTMPVDAESTSSPTDASLNMKRSASSPDVRNSHVGWGIPLRAPSADE